MTQRDVLASGPDGGSLPAWARAAGVAVLAVGSLTGYLVQQHPDSPAPPAPQRPAATAGSAEVTALYRPSPLDGHWLSRPLHGDRAGQRLTLQVRGTAWVVWIGDADNPERRILDYEAVSVHGHTLELRPVGVSDAVAVYRWTRSGDRLRLRLVSRTRRAGDPRLVTRRFSRA